MYFDEYFNESTDYINEILSNVMDPSFSLFTFDYEENKSKSPATKADSKNPKKTEVKSKPLQFVDMDEEKLINSAKDISQALTINPQMLGFVPESKWIGITEIKLQTLSKDYFKPRSNKYGRFQHKLWNSLILVENFPHLYVKIGVKWLDDFVIQVNQKIFGSHLGLDKPKHSLFIPQGSFQSHGFVEVDYRELPDELKEKAENDDMTRFFKSRYGTFKRGRTPDFSKCSWTPEHQKR